MARVVKKRCRLDPFPPGLGSSRNTRGLRLWTFGKPPKPIQPDKEAKPDWIQARPSDIQKNLARGMGGGWVTGRKAPGGP
jgi:hypothetical protein